MSNVVNCPTCGSKAKITNTGQNTTYQTLQDDELVKKVGQLKKAMQKYQEKAEVLEKEIQRLTHLA
jgi:hypothetical protein|tara:strand:- start:790 stop:987 length:198 start_codon:yes stop_codon:yes gene_type:complete